MSTPQCYPQTTSPQCGKKQRTRCVCSLFVFSRLLTYDFFRSRACCADTRFRSNLRRHKFKLCAHTAVIEL